MLFGTFALALLSASSVLAGSTSTRKGRICAGEVGEDKWHRYEDHFRTNKVSHDSRYGEKGSRTAGKVSVFWHVITENETYAGGALSQSQIEDQIDVLNKAYNGTLVFKLRNVTHTRNKDWFDHAGPETKQQTAMKRKLRVGTKKSLNVYSVGFTSLKPDDDGLLGYATFPYDYRENKKDDGVVLQYATLPGGALAPYNLGHTLTHEVGHWVGLYHTFQGGCEKSDTDGDGVTGDGVSDTPAQGESTSGCPAKPANTCPGLKGVDPIHNFMDYSDDECLTEFTPGQVKRIRDQMSTYRHVEFEDMFRLGSKPH